jgi:hypothetical protein
MPAEAECGAEAKRLFDLLFCEGIAADAHCKKLEGAMERYRKGYREPMRAWLAKERPTNLPSTLLYPFAGGDLVSALSSFPDQREFVHLSLEHGGPPAPFKDGASPRLTQARGMLFRMADLLLRHGESFSVDLQKQEQALLPGVLPMLLVGVKVHGGTPTGLAYLKVTPEGSLQRWTRNELDAPGPRARRLYTTWKDPKFSARFANLELRFRLPGDSSDRRVIHLSANLADVGLKRAPGVDRYLSALGPSALMIKASSYLMWTGDFSRIRDLIFEKASFAISDFTAPYPGWLKKRGFSLGLHGRYDCMRNPRLRESAKPWIEAFRRPTSQALPFRWGYIDCKNQNHVVLIRK